MVYVFSYLNAVATLLITFGVAKVLHPSAFQHIALGLIAGAFGSVLTNLGSDQGQLNAMLRFRTPHSRRASALGDLKRRLVVLVILSASLVSYSADESASAALTRALFFAWAAMLGLAPNGYVDFLKQQRRQQLATFVERGLALLVLLGLLMVVGDRALYFSVLAGCFLVGIRALAIAYQWAATISGDHAQTPEQPKETKSAGTFYPTVAAVCNSCTAYVPALFLDFYDRKSELALYTLTAQALSLVILFHGVAARLASGKLAETIVHGGQSTDAFSAARRIFLLSLPIAAVGAAATAFYLTHIGIPAPVRHIVLLVSIMFAWAAWLGFGQVITRTITLTGHSRVYAAASAATTLISVGSAFALVRDFGAVGSALAIVLPHTLMIGLCAVYLKRIGGSEA